MTRTMLAAAAALTGLWATAGLAQDLTAAAAQYEAVCENCHGPTGKGMASFPALAGQDAAYLSNRLMQYRAGEQVGYNSALMIPNATELSDAEIADLAAYIATNFQ